MKAEGTSSKAPLTESFARWGNLRLVILALLGATAGQAVVWYCGQFYALFFLTQVLKVEAQTANLLIAASLLVGTPFFVVFGILSDKIGRKKIILAGCLLAAITYVPIFKGLTHYANPAIEHASSQSPVTVLAVRTRFPSSLIQWARRNSFSLATWPRLRSPRRACRMPTMLPPWAASPRSASAMAR